MRLAPFVCMLALLLAWPVGAPLCQTRHFFNSQQHFQEFSNQASVLAKRLENPGEINILNYYGACSLIYTAKAHGLAQLADLAVNMRLPEDRAMVRQRYLESVHYVTATLADEIRTLESMNALSTNSSVTSLGARLINELRVFENNTQNYLP